MLVSPALHLSNEFVVAGEQRGLLLHPTKCFGVLTVAGLPKRKDVPEPTKLPMLTQQVLAAEYPRGGKSRIRMDLEVNRLGTPSPEPPNFLL